MKARHLTPLVLLAGLCAAAPSFAAMSASDCEAAAIDKNGKALAGAAKGSFMQKCEREAKISMECDAKAMGKDGKPLYGAAKASSIRKCEEDARAAAGK